MAPAPPPAKISHHFIAPRRYRLRPRRRSEVVRQGSAKPSSPVQIRAPPPMIIPRRARAGAALARSQPPEALERAAHEVDPESGDEHAEQQAQVRTLDLVGE